MTYSDIRASSACFLSAASLFRRGQPLTLGGFFTPSFSASSLVVTIFSTFHISALLRHHVMKERRRITSPSRLPPRIFVKTVSPISMELPVLSWTWSDISIQRVWEPGSMSVRFIFGCEYTVRVSRLHLRFNKPRVSIRAVMSLENTSPLMT
jgi:hypothetical protein